MHEDFQPTERLLNKKQVAMMYSCHPKTVTKLEAAGKIPRRVDDAPTVDAKWLESEVVAHLRGLRKKAEAV